VAGAGPGEPEFPPMEEEVKEIPQPD